MKGSILVCSIVPALLGAASQSHSDMSRVREAFLHAKRPEQMSVRSSAAKSGWARSVAAQKTTPPFDRAALFYWLALEGRTPNPDVRRLVKTCVQAGVGRTEDTDALSALPEALETIALARNDPTAAEEILTLDLDGGPGDTIDSVRTELVLSRPMLVASCLQRLGHGSLARLNKASLFRPLRESLTTEIQYTPGYKQKLARVANELKSKGASGKLFVAFVRRMMG